MRMKIVLLLALAFVTACGRSAPEKEKPAQGGQASKTARKATATVGVYRPGESFFYLSNRNVGSAPEAVVHLGLKGDLPVAGDWDGNGSVTAGVYRPGERIF